MAHDIQGRVWIIDTSATGQVSSFPVKIKNIFVTWKVASAGVLEFGELLSQASTGTPRKWLTAETLGATSAGWDQMTQPIPVDTLFQNCWLVTATNIKSCYVVTD